jgi:hypothetical protein
LTPCSRPPPCRDPNPDPIVQRHNSSTPRRLRRRHAHRGHPAEPARHRPPLDPSLRRQTQLDPRNQFPESVLLERGRKPCPDRARPTSTERPERARRSCVP